MPKLTKLTQQEAEKVRQRLGAVDLGQYIDFLNTVKPGDWGEVTLEEGESQRAIKRRFTKAAKQVGKTITYRTSEDKKIIFEVK